MRLYLAGPMSGIPAFNYPAFLEAGAALREVGYDVDSPAEAEIADGFDPHAPESGYTPTDYLASMRRDVDMILAPVDGIAVLPGWEASRGARAETALAAAVGIPVRSVKEWLVATGREADA